MRDLAFDLDDAAASLTRMPAVLRALLADLPEAWTQATEGPGTWSPRQVVAHLLDGERVDWVPRAKTILKHGEDQPFTTYDRAASLTEADCVPLGTLLDRFEAARAENVRWLRSAGLTEADLARTGRHPELGVVTLRQLLVTWVAHDHGHIVQIARTLARRYRHEVGPWAAYLSVMGPPRG